MPNKQELDKIKKRINLAQGAFPMAVEAICIEIIDMANQIAPAIGEVSIDEAKEVIIREFTNKMREPIILG